MKLAMHLLVSSIAYMTAAPECFAAGHVTRETPEIEMSLYMWPVQPDSLWVCRWWFVQVLVFFAY